MKNLRDFDRLLPMDMVSYVPWAGAPTERQRISIRDMSDYQTVDGLRKHFLGPNPTAAKEKSFQVTRLGDLYELKPEEYVAPGDFVTFSVGKAYTTNEKSARVHCFQVTREQLNLHGTIVTLAQYRKKCQHLVGLCVYRFIGDKSALQMVATRNEAKPPASVCTAVTISDPIKDPASGIVGLFITALNQLPNPVVLWDNSTPKEIDETLFV